MDSVQTANNIGTRTTPQIALTEKQSTQTKLNIKLYNV